MLHQYVVFPSELTYCVLMIIIGGNELTGNIPSEFGMLPELKAVDFSDNMLTGAIPSEFGTLVALEVMVLGKYIWLVMKCINAMFDFMYSLRCLQYFEM